MLLVMSSTDRKGVSVVWTEQDRLDARRLLAELDARSKRKAAERLEASAQIQESEAAGPCVALEKSESPERMRSAALQGLSQSTDANGEECRGSGLEYGRHAAGEASEPISLEDISGRACPNPDSTADADRAKRHAPSVR